MLEEKLNQEIIEKIELEERKKCEEIQWKIEMEFSQQTDGNSIERN